MYRPTVYRPTTPRGPLLVLVTVAGRGEEVYAKAYGPEAADDAHALRNAALERGYLDARIVRETDFLEETKPHRAGPARPAMAA